jgi:glucans biosynthesis protein C
LAAPAVSFPAVDGSDPARQADRTVRLPALDAVRAGALLLGIVLHATLAFLPPGELRVWPVVDRTSSHTLGLATFVIHTFRMLLFFILAGLFARMLMFRDGMGGFIRGRARRVLLPFVAALVVLVPVTAAIPLVVAYDGFEFGRLPQFMHLWFLYLLLWFYALIVIATITGRVAPLALHRLLQRVGDRVAHSAWLPVVVAIPCAAALLSLPVWVPWFGIPPAEALPNRAAWVCYGTAVWVGWLLHRRLDALQVLERRRWAYAALAITATVACLAIVGVRPNYAVVAGGTGPAVYAWLYIVAGWSWSLAIIGFATRVSAAPNPAVRFVADASYWVYLMHLPLILLVQAAIATWYIHWAVKFLVVAGLPIPVLFGSYYVLFGKAAPGRPRVATS